LPDAALAPSTLAYECVGTSGAAFSRPERSAAATGADRRLYAVGEFGLGTLLDTAEVYDPKKASDGWSRWRPCQLDAETSPLPPEPMGRHRHMDITGRLWLPVPGSWVRPLAPIGTFMRPRIGQLQGA